MKQHPKTAYIIQIVLKFVALLFCFVGRDLWSNGSYFQSALFISAGWGMIDIWFTFKKHIGGDE